MFQKNAFFKKNSPYIVSEVDFVTAAIFENDCNSDYFRTILNNIDRQDQLHSYNLNGRRYLFKCG